MQSIKFWRLGLRSLENPQMFVLSLPEVLAPCILGGPVESVDLVGQRGDWSTFVLVTVDTVARQTLDNYVLIKVFDLIPAVNALVGGHFPPCCASYKRLYPACLR